MKEIQPILDGFESLLNALADEEIQTAINLFIEEVKDSLKHYGCGSEGYLSVVEDPGWLGEVQYDALVGIRLDPGGRGVFVLSEQGVVVTFLRFGLKATEFVQANYLSKPEPELVKDPYKDEAVDIIKEFFDGIGEIRERTPFHFITRKIGPEELHQVIVEDPPEQIIDGVVLVYMVNGYKTTIHASKTKFVVNCPEGETNKFLVTRATRILNRVLLGTDARLSIPISTSKCSVTRREVLRSIIDEKPKNDLNFKNGMVWKIEGGKIGVQHINGKYLVTML